jgi:hypothetical protein
VSIREVRFTLPFRRTITIATSRIARVSSSARTEDVAFAKVPAMVGDAHGVTDPRWRMSAICGGPVEPVGGRKAL